jgi:hypothetical protein
MTPGCSGCQIAVNHCEFRYKVRISRSGRSPLLDWVRFVELRFGPPATPARGRPANGSAAGGTAGGPAVRPELGSFRIPARSAAPVRFLVGSVHHELLSYQSQIAGGSACSYLNVGGETEREAMLICLRDWERRKKFEATGATGLRRPTLLRHPGSTLGTHTVREVSVGMHRDV